MTKQPMHEWFRAVRRTSTPLVVIESHDEVATQAEVVQLGLGEKVIPAIYTWDCAQGYQRKSEQAQEIEKSDQIEDALLYVGREEIGIKSIIIYQWRSEYWQSPLVRQAFINLRENCKRKQITVVLIIPYGQEVPSDIAVHVIKHSEDLPGKDKLAHIACAIQESGRIQDQQIPELTGERLDDVVAALRGMNAYQAEQWSAMALKKGEGIDIRRLWESKIELINSVPGLQVWRGGQNFDDIAGLEGAKKYFKAMIEGKLPVRLVIWMDEIEDMIAGTQGDMTGISQAYQGKLAGHLEDTRARCVLCFGHPGTGKSLTAKAIASEARCLCISLDLGTMKGSLVGQSEAQLARALAIERALVGNELGSTLWVWTTNDPSRIDRKLRSRMRGELFYDSPDEQERLAIWSLHRNIYHLPVQDLPNDEGWVGREIERCCALAWEDNCSIMQASRRIIPKAVVDRKVIEERRKAAHLHYLSAQYEGWYRCPGMDEKEPGRRIDL